jgi:hypothetical protein
MKPAGSVMVCVDCYFAHHFGVVTQERPMSGAEEANYLNGWTHLDPPGRIEYTDNELMITQWFAGDSDTPCDREPLLLLDDYELADWVVDGEGIDEFSWSSCEGCGSGLGGSRYRLALYEREA